MRQGRATDQQYRQRDLFAPVRKPSEDQAAIQSRNSSPPQRRALRPRGFGPSARCSSKRGRSKLPFRGRPPCLPVAWRRFSHRRGSPRPAHRPGNRQRESQECPSLTFIRRNASYSFAPSLTGRLRDNPFIINCIQANLRALARLNIRFIDFHANRAHDDIQRKDHAKFIFSPNEYALHSC